MKWLLHENKALNYYVADTFEGNMLVPIMKNMLYKAETEWDDYNEAYHCCRFIEIVRKKSPAKMEFHYVKKGEDTIGVGLITCGEINTLPSFPVDFHLPSSTDKILLFSYFHVSPEGRGIGEHWLRDIILPYYAGKGFESVYVKSSHPKVFSLYKRFDESHKQSLLPNKTIAILGGLGWIGKNNLLITPEYGAAQCLGTVLTDAPLETVLYEPLQPKCGNCTTCINVCERKVLKGKIWSSSVSRDEIVDVFGCSTCLKCLVHCPYTHRYCKK